MKSCLGYATLAALVLGLTLSASARDVVLPAGTLLQCTLNEPNFSSATAAVGDPVLCHLRGLTEFGQQAFPRGSYLVGHLESAKDPGHFFGKGNMKLQFDRIGLPSGDLPLEAKVIATRAGYRVDRQGGIVGKGHAKRDVVEWMLPPLWPWKVLMLPARGPRPTLKGESVMTLRLMDDVQLPQVGQGRERFGPGWQFFGGPKPEPTTESFREPQFRQTTPQLAVRDVSPASDEQSLTLPQASYASLVTKYVPAPAPASPASSEAQSAATRAAASAPGMPVFVLKSGMVLPVGNFTYRDGRIAYTLAGGGDGVIGTDEIDWSTTTRLNSERGVRVTLRGGHPSQGAPGL
jgi:hypothetical protein